MGSRLRFRSHEQDGGVLLRRGRPQRHAASGDPAMAFFSLGSSGFIAAQTSWPPID
jgi:hypothetical protein